MVRCPDEIFEVNPDVVIMGILTGYEDAKNYLIDKGYPEEKIITKHVDLSTRARRQCLYDTAKIIKECSVEGAVAELGVYRGDFAKDINSVFPGRVLYLFDTFEGFSEYDFEHDNKTELLTNYVGRFADTSVDLVLSRMPFADKCVVKKGYFPSTTNGLEDVRYAFVSIDVDLYEPILAGLNYFWPRMSIGGYIFIHDYFSQSYFGTRKAIKEFADKNKIVYTPIGDTLSVCFCKGGR